MRQWSQEQLAAISGLNTRTIQRAEQGTAVDAHTRRALARAFDLEDIDALNKPFSISSEEELKAAREKFDREHVTVSITPLDRGRQLAKVVEACEMGYAEPAFDLERPAAEAFAALIDAFREYRDCAELHSELQKLDVYDEFQRRIDELNSLGVSLCSGERKLYATMGARDPSVKPVALTAL